jgi:murein DD-endopeptidase MepM/ murein hydrolase activator NlpD
MRPEDLIPGDWKYVNLVDNRQFVKDNPGTWMCQLEERYGGKIYGGYLEDRSPFFDDRHDSKLRIHIGVDMWAPAGTKITFPHDAIVRFARIATATRGGGGGRVDLQYKDYVYIFGHLVEPTLKEGDIFRGGDIVGRLAPRELNGGWMPHLHIQKMEADWYDGCDPNEIDAYFHDKKLALAFYFDPFKKEEI